MEDTNDVDFQDRTIMEDTREYEAVYFIKDKKKDYK